ncbi:MAG: BlaI/MecI/CopY family transcriptional regulator [Verrucomicrobiota bacterium]
MTARQALSDRETDLIKSLWKLGDGTVPALVEALNEDSENPITRGTIQVLLNRMETKRWVKRHKVGRSYVYKATVSEERGLAELTGAFHDKVFDGSALELVQALVRANRMTPPDIEELRALLDETEKKLKDT